MKRKELFWMIAPCLLLAGTPWFIQLREARRRAAILAPKQLRIESVQKETPSTSEIAAGYDTRIVVTVLQGPPKTRNGKTLYLMPGATNIQLLGEKGTKPLSIPIRYEVNGQLSASDMMPDIGQRQEKTRIAFSLPLSEISPSEGALTLKGFIVGTACEEQTVMTPTEVQIDRGTASKAQTPQPLALEIPVRLRDEKVAALPTLVPCPLRLKNYQVQTFGSVGSVVKLEVEYKNPDGTPVLQQPHFTFEETCVVDAKGRKFPLTQGHWRYSFSAEVASSINPTPSTTNLHYIKLGVPTNMLHEAKGKLILKTLISANGSWPLPFSAEVRSSPTPKTKNQ